MYLKQHYYRYNNKYIQGQCPGRNFKEQNGLTQLLFNVFDDLYEENNLADTYPDIVNNMKQLLPEGFCVSKNNDTYYDQIWTAQALKNFE